MASETLHQVCFSKGLEDVQRIAASLPEPKLVEKDDDRRTPLHWAAAGGKAETVAWLLTHEGVRTKVNARDEAGYTALMSAVACGCVGAVKALIAAGADALLPNEDGAVALHYHKGRVAVLELLLPLYRDVNVKDDRGITALHRAAGPGHIDAVRALLAAGANPNASDSRGETALHFACEEQRVEVAALLIENGASLRAKNNEGQIPLELCKDSRALQTIAQFGIAQAKG
jgi:ankyrin repeat protein